MQSTTNIMPGTTAFAIFLLVAITACQQPADSDPEKATAPPTIDSLCAQKTPDNFCIISLGSASPVRFETKQSNMQQLPDHTLQVSDQLIIVTPQFRWTLTEARVIFKPSATGGFDRIAGEARIPFDKVPILKKAKTGGGIMAALGYDQGKNLGDLEAPLNADTHYLFFAFKENFGVSFGFDDLGIPVRGGDTASKPFTFSPVPSAKLVMALDANDPFFYVSAKGISPRKKDNKKKDENDRKKKTSLNIGGFGYSFQGKIPESVSTTDFSRTMTGNLVLEGSVPFPPLPAIQYTGYYLVRQDATLQAIDGDITVGFPLKFLTSFSVSLGNATAIAEVDDKHAEIFMGGQFKPDTSWIPAIIPLFPEQDVRLALQLDTGNAANNQLHGKGRFAIAGSGFAPKGLQFGEVLSNNGEFHITPEFIRMKGGIDSDLSPFSFGTGTHFDATIEANKQHNHLTIDGNIFISSLDTKGQLEITPDIVTLTGVLNRSHDWPMSLEGKLHNPSGEGMMFSGRFEVPLYLNDRIGTTISQSVEQTKQDLNQKISDLTEQLNSLTTDLPGVRKAAKSAAETALWNMNTDHEKAIVNQEIANHCKGKLIPGCKALATKTYNDSKDVANARAQLNTLVRQLDRKDDKSTREALKTALQQVINSNPVTIDLKVQKVKIPYLNDERKKHLQTAINHIDNLKTTGGKQLNARQELEKFTGSTLNQLARDIKQNTNPISIESITFDIPATHTGSIKLSVSLSLHGKPPGKPLAITFDPKHPEQLPVRIVQQL